jgi:hypothetical protein
MGGDLNFSLGALDIWELVVQMDYISNYFMEKLDEDGFLDVEPIKLTPT